MGPGSFMWKFTLPEREQSRKRKDHPLEARKNLFITEKKSGYLEADYEKNSTLQPKNNENVPYVIGCFLVKEINVSSITEYLKRFECEPMETSIKRINDQLTKFSDDEISSEEVKISLACPIVRSFGSLKIPVRGFKCQHLDCFDLENFLAMNCKMQVFKCPL